MRTWRAAIIVRTHSRMRRENCKTISHEPWPHASTEFNKVNTTQRPPSLQQSPLRTSRAVIVVRTHALSHAPQTKPEIHHTTMTSCKHRIQQVHTHYDTPTITHAYLEGGGCCAYALSNAPQAKPETPTNNMTNHDLMQAQNATSTHNTTMLFLRTWRAVIVVRTHALSHAPQAKPETHIVEITCHGLMQTQNSTTTQRKQRNTSPKQPTTNNDDLEDEARNTPYNHDLMQAQNSAGTHTLRYSNNHPCVHGGWWLLCVRTLECAAGEARNPYQ